MSNQRIGANCESARDLNCIGELQLQISAQPSRAFGNVSGQQDYVPRLHDIPIALREHLLPSGKRAGEYFRHRNRRYRERNFACCLSIEYRPEPCGEPWMVFEKVDDGRAVHQDQRTACQCGAIYRLHSSRNRRNVRARAPQRPFPEPIRSTSPF